MLNSLNSTFGYNSNTFNKFSQNNNKLFEDENAVCEPMNGTGSGTNRYPVLEIDQYLNTIFQNNGGGGGGVDAGAGLSLKTEDSHSRMTHTDCEDSGFVTCNSSGLSSPQLSPMSASSHYSAVETNTSASHPFEDYTQLSFHGIANSSNWSLASLSDHSAPTPAVPPLPKQIKLFSNYSSKSVHQNCELRITKQPETHHRARYMTEGSRGTIKDRTGRGYPVVQLFGYNKSSVKLQCFVGHDQKIGEPHLFYQACEVSGKTAYRFAKVDGINVIELELLPKNNMQSILDCMGILKERNVDVERKVLRSRRKGQRSCPVTTATAIANEEVKMIRNTNKCRSTHCRMVFRCLLPDTGEVLQVVSDPILCTQPLGSPEIYKISLRESDVKGGNDLFIIGKNFHKDSKVLFTNSNRWRKVVIPQKEFLNSTHLVCQIPGYESPDALCSSIITCEVSVVCNHKTSDPIKFIYTNSAFATNSR